MILNRRTPLLALAATWCCLQNNHGPARSELAQQTHQKWVENHFRPVARWM